MTFILRNKSNNEALSHYQSAFFKVSHNSLAKNEE